MQFRFFAVFFVVLLWPQYALTQISADVLPDLYERGWYGPEDKRASCTVKVRELVNDANVADYIERLRHAEKHLQSIDCLDQYSRLYMPSRRTGSVLSGPFSMQRTASVLQTDGYTFVRIRAFFGSDTSLTQSIRTMTASLHGTRAIVIDLRDNAGGIIADLHDVLDHHFSPKAGVPFMHTIGAPDAGITRQVTTGRGTFAGMKLIMLVNSATASASEWMVSVLCHEWYSDRCMIVGEPTVGKTVIQCVIGDSVGGMMLTCAEWLVRGKERASVVLKTADGVHIQPHRRVDVNRCGSNNRCLASLLKALR